MALPTDSVVVLAAFVNCTPPPDWNTAPFPEAAFPTRSESCTRVPPWTLRIALPAAPATVTTLVPEEAKLPLRFVVPPLKVLLPEKGLLSDGSPTNVSVPAPVFVKAPEPIIGPSRSVPPAFETSTVAAPVRLSRAADRSTVPLAFAACSDPPASVIPLATVPPSVPSCSAAEKLSVPADTVVPPE